MRWSNTHKHNTVARLLNRLLFLGDTYCQSLFGYDTTEAVAYKDKGPACLLIKHQHKHCKQRRLSYLFGPTHIDQFCEQLHGDVAQVLSSSEVDKSRIVAIGHYPYVGHKFGQQVLERRHLALFVSPCVKCMSV